MVDNHVKTSFFNALGTAAYTALVSWFLFNAQAFFGDKPDNFLAPMFMMILLVVSAAVTGYLVLSKPLRLFYASQVKEGITLFFWTLGWLLLFAIIIGVLIAVI